MAQILALLSSSVTHVTPGGGPSRHGPGRGSGGGAACEGSEAGSTVVASEEADRSGSGGNAPVTTPVVACLDRNTCSIALLASLLATASSREIVGPLTADDCPGRSTKAARKASSTASWNSFVCAGSSAACGAASSVRSMMFDVPTQFLSGVRLCFALLCFVLLCFALRCFALICLALLVRKRANSRDPV